MSRYGLEIEQEALTDELVGGVDVKIKKCSKCGFEGKENLFHKSKNLCKECVSKYNVEYRKSLTNDMKEKYDINRIKRKDDIKKCNICGTEG